MIRRANTTGWGHCGPDQSTFLNGAYAAPRIEDTMQTKIDVQAAKVAALRSDLADYRRQGSFFEIRRGTEELRAAEAELDRLVQVTPPTRAWSDRPERAVRRMAQ